MSWNNFSFLCLANLLVRNSSALYDSSMSTSHCQEPTALPKLIVAFSVSPRCLCLPASSLCQQKCLCSLTVNLIHKWIQVKINLRWGKKKEKKKFLLVQISSLICLGSPAIIGNNLVEEPQGTWQMHHLHYFLVSVIPLAVVDPDCLGRHSVQVWWFRFSLFVSDKMGTSIWLAIFCSAERSTSPQCC